MSSPDYKNHLIINLSILLSQPTGISNYTQNLVPYLKPLNPTLLTAQNKPDFNCHQIPDNLTPGHNSNYRKFIKTSNPPFYSPPSPKHLYSLIPATSSPSTTSFPCAFPNPPHHYSPTIATTSLKY
jgi:hypothetical protein